MTESKADLELRLLKEIIRIFARALDSEEIEFNKLVEQNKAKVLSEVRAMIVLSSFAASVLRSIVGFCEDYFQNNDDWPSQETLNNFMKFTLRDILPDYPD